MTNIESILFKSEVPAIALALYQNEKPPRGLAGILDWHFHGKISDFLKEGMITGQLGECTYIPMQRHGSTFHFLFAGAGQAPSPGTRNLAPKETLKVLHQNLLKLKVSKVGVSLTDFGNISAEQITEQLKGVPLWIST